MTIARANPRVACNADPKSLAASAFAGYHCRHVDGFIASEPIGNGPLGFAENIEAPLEWESVDDIGERKLAIGTVLGYANTDESWGALALILFGAWLVEPKGADEQVRLDLRFVRRRGVPSTPQSPAALPLRSAARPHGRTPTDAAAAGAHS